MIEVEILRISDVICAKNRGQNYLLNCTFYINIDIKYIFCLKGALDIYRAIKSKTGTSIALKCGENRGTTNIYFSILSS